MLERRVLKLLRGDGTQFIGAGVGVDGGVGSSPIVRRGRAEYMARRCIGGTCERSPLIASLFFLLFACSNGALFSSILKCNFFIL